MKQKKIYIYHDYQGIASWCLGEWKTNKEGTRQYKEYYDSVKDSIEIVFCKVKGHSGDTWKHLADELAKQSRGQLNLFIWNRHFLPLRKNTSVN